MSRIVFVLFGSLLFASDYSFQGRHFLASYLECDQTALESLDDLQVAMDQAICASGATLLQKSAYVFPPNGITVVYLLSESHGSLHTYPEHGACFVDLFTCGDHCVAAKFDEALRAYLQPKQVNARFFSRGENVEEIPYP
jgi:S-adenosylmethionine decarboxylase